MPHNEIIHIREVPLSQFTRQAKKLRDVANQAESIKERLCELSSYEEEIHLTKIANTGYRLNAFLNAASPQKHLTELINQLENELSSYEKEIRAHANTEPCHELTDKTPQQP
ncbi:hypothetical protein FF011L_12310 [Roseimaritima multifibrata]|uniref:Uncharacterized protein n=1 Tax=Roseimaritima multifibrata TaxID=1930274 RepID=A0A517MC65_9BACT|nr:hypothetical protein [Roseimaritima multifibrata]QDS92488.1 hypothetical protein FF011L_12310 [Roseimaritima multifibrata]